MLKRDVVSTHRKPFFIILICKRRARISAYTTMMECFHESDFNANVFTFFGLGAGKLENLYDEIIVILNCETVCVR